VSSGGAYFQLLSAGDLGTLQSSEVHEGYLRRKSKSMSVPMSQEGKTERRRQIEKTSERQFDSSLVITALVASILFEERKKGNVRLYSWTFCTESG
jgi:hypothetical protein